MRGVLCGLTVCVEQGSRLPGAPARQVFLEGVPVLCPEWQGEQNGDPGGADLGSHDGEEGPGQLQRKLRSRPRHGPMEQGTNAEVGNWDSRSGKDWERAVRLDHWVPFLVLILLTRDQGRSWARSSQSPVMHSGCLFLQAPFSEMDFGRQ